MALTRDKVAERVAKMHDKSACLLNRHLHPLNRGTVPLCEECWGHNPERDQLWALILAAP